MPASAPPAHVEDVNEENGEIDPDSRKYANNGAKRSNQSLKKDKPIRQDVPSDSGVSGSSYSSHTSGGSDPSSRQARTVGDPPVTSKRRPTVSGREEIKRESRHRSPEKPARRSDSKARRHDPSQYTTASCKDPECRGECQVTYQRRATRPSPLDTGMDTNYYPFPSHNLTAYQQPSPSYSQPAISPYSQANVSYGLPVGSRPRAISSANRPTSYHGYNGPIPPQPVGGSYSGAPQAYQNSHQSYDPFVSGYVQPPVLGQPGFPMPYTMPGSPLRSSARPGLPHAMTDGVDYSPRASAHPAKDIPRYKSDPRQEFQDDDDYITTRPGRRGSFAPPYHGDDTSESSPERESDAYRRRDRRNDRDMMPPPPSHRPYLRHSATTSDAVPRRSESSRPVVLRHEPVYDYPSDHYDTDRSTRAVIAGTSHHRRPSDSRRSEKSYKTHISDPVAYRSSAGEMDYSSSRRMSANSLRRLEDQRVADIQQYQDNMRGFAETDMTADWLVNQNRKALSSGRTPSAVSSSSHRSHRSRHSISSRTSVTGGMTIVHKGATVDVPEGHNVSLEFSPESGRSRLVIEDATQREKSYVGGSSVRSSAQVSSGSQSRRSRAESEASRGRKHSVRPESRRPSD